MKRYRNLFANVFPRASKPGEVKEKEKFFTLREEIFFLLLSQHFPDDKICIRKILFEKVCSNFESYRIYFMNQ
jgi:hypothetical protein